MAQIALVAAFSSSAIPAIRGRAEMTAPSSDTGWTFWDFPGILVCALATSCSTNQHRAVPTSTVVGAFNGGRLGLEFDSARPPHLSDRRLPEVVHRPRPRLYIFSLYRRVLRRHVLLDLSDLDVGELAAVLGSESKARLLHLVASIRRGAACGRQ